MDEWMDLALRKCGSLKCEVLMMMVGVWEN